MAKTEGKLRESLSLSISSCKQENRKGLDTLWTTRNTLIKIDEGFAGASDALKNEILPGNRVEKPRKLEELIDNADYIDSFTLLKETLRRYILFNQENSNMSKIYSYFMSNVALKMNEMKNHAAIDEMGEFSTNFIDTEKYLRDLMNQSLFLESQVVDIKEKTERGLVKKETYKDITQEFNKLESESVFPDDESVAESRADLLKEKYQQRSEYLEHISQALDTFLPGLKLPQELKMFLISNKSPLITKDIKENMGDFERLIDNTVGFDSILNRKLKRQPSPSPTPVVKEKTETRVTIDGKPLSSVNDISEDLESPETSTTSVVTSPYFIGALVQDLCAQRLAGRADYYVARKILQNQNQTENRHCHP
jgi:heme oxygenase